MAVTEHTVLAGPEEFRDITHEGDRPTMPVYGGIEWTESSMTELRSYPGVASALAPIAPVRSINVGAGQLHFHHVAPAALAGLVGAQRGTDHEVLRTGRVKLTNDVGTAEWVVMGHAGAADTATMMANMKQDVATVLSLREQLKGTIAALQSAHLGEVIIIAPDAVGGNLRAPGPEGVFQYVPHATNTGAAQLTVQYTNVGTITRINRVNASKYLTGTKVSPGEDAAIVADALDWKQWAKYNQPFVQTSYATAGDLLTGLVALAAPVAAGGANLTAQQVGLVMLMVLNDAMACTIRRFAANLGQSDDKNVQRFYPKSLRRCYVDAACQAAVPPAALNAVQAQIHAAAPAIAQLEWNHCDPAALDVKPTVQELNAAGQAATVAALLSANAKAANDKPTTTAERNVIKNSVLGVNGATLATWIQRAAIAYADTSLNGAQHFDGGGNGRIIPSINFSPVAGGVHGAVYEFREREVPISIEDFKTVSDVLTVLFDAST